MWSAGLGIARQGYGISKHVRPIDVGGYRCNSCRQQLESRRIRLPYREKEVWNAGSAVPGQWQLNNERCGID